MIIGIIILATLTLYSYTCMELIERSGNHE